MFSVHGSVLPASELERALFGYEEGSRKVRPGALENARDRTLFLGEVEALPLMLQVKLLRALVDRKFTWVDGSKHIDLGDIRCISATSQKLNIRVDEKNFRSDLYYRLAGDVIFLPPLRERTEDFELLIKNVLDMKRDTLERERGLSEIRFSAGTRNVIKQYHWPRKCP